MNLSPEKVAHAAAEAAENKKARNVVILNIHDISTICDYFVICSGSSSTQVQAVAENVEEALEQLGLQKLRIEGFKDAQWVLLDYGAVVVHIFQQDARDFYNLEHLWGDARVVYL